ncbi:MAG: LacI family DNA-binding transcriptional regulator [Burkholderiales bacterium]|nr:LacI family DNA-binding transcriptional regulator [Burkholderiales bacterium]
MSDDIGKAKLDDVARVAGVSLATASRALSAPQLLRPDTLLRVLDAARLLGYLPHGAARALASRRTHTIGAVIPTLDNAIFANSTQALQRELGEHGYQLLLGSHEYDPEREVQVTRALLERGVDGLALVGTDHSPELYQLLVGFRSPYVLTWSLDESEHHYCVGFNNREVGARVAQYLHHLGHREFAVISGFTAHNDRARDRITGVREALSARGIELGPQRVVETSFSIQSGREALLAVLQYSPRPSAVICGNDILAQGVMIEALAQGIEIPRSLSITGVDDMELSAHMPPGLTTVRIPTAEIGRRTAQHILARLNGEKTEKCTELAVELIVRGSTAPPL